MAEVSVAARMLRDGAGAIGAGTSTASGEFAILSFVYPRPSPSSAEKPPVPHTAKGWQAQYLSPGAVFGVQADAQRQPIQSCPIFYSLARWSREPFATNRRSFPLEPAGGAVATSKSCLLARSRSAPFVDEGFRTCQRGWFLGTDLDSARLAIATFCLQKGDEVMALGPSGAEHGP